MEQELLQDLHWPSPLSLVLGERLYKEWINYDPMPGDKLFQELPESDQQAWCFMAMVVVQKFVAMTGEDHVGRLGR